MKKIWLKGFIEKLNRDDGISIMAIVALMLMMTVMGGVFTSIMGEWKKSAPLTVNSNRALQLANTAATFAIQEASRTFYGGNFNYGLRDNPYTVYSDGNGGVADYWFEMPGANDDGISVGTVNSDDDDVNDDLDDNYIDDATLSRHTIVATGRVINGGVTVAKRQIKVFADIRQSAVGNIAPGVHTEGAIHGNGVAGYEMWKDGSNVNVDPPDAAFNNNYADSTVALDADGDGVDDRDGIVYQSPAYTPPVIEKEVFIALAKSQGHFHSGDFAPGDNYPNGSFYYSGDAPNIVYVTGNLSFNGNRVVYGVYYVENGTVSMGGNCQLQGIVFCNNDFAAEGGGNKSPNLVGGIIQYGGLTELGGNGNPVEILIDNTFFQKLEQEQPFIDIPVWQQSVSLN